MRAHFRVDPYMFSILFFAGRCSPCKRAGGGAGTVGGVGILVSVLVLLAFKKTKIAATAVTGSEKQIVKKNWGDP